MADARQVTLTVPDTLVPAVSQAFYDSTGWPLWRDAADSEGNVPLAASTASRLHDRLEAIVMLSRLCCKHGDSEGHEAGRFLEPREFGGLTKAINLLATDSLTEVGNVVVSLLEAQDGEVQS